MTVSVRGHAVQEGRAGGPGRAHSRCSGEGFSWEPGGLQGWRPNCLQGLTSRAGGIPGQDALQRTFRVDRVSLRDFEQYLKH